MDLCFINVSGRCCIYISLTRSAMLLILEHLKEDFVLVQSLFFCYLNTFWPAASVLRLLICLFVCFASHQNIAIRSVTGQWFLTEAECGWSWIQCSCFLQAEVCHALLRNPHPSPPLGLCSARLNQKESFCCFFLIERVRRQDSWPRSQDASVVGVHGPPWGGESQHRGPAKPTECQQPQHRHPQQVQSRGNGGSQSGATLCAECAVLQWAKHEDWHEV